MSSFLKNNIYSKNVVTTFGTKRGVLIRTALFVVALILLLAYLGITFTDVKENEFVQYLVSLFLSFFN